MSPRLAKLVHGRHRLRQLHERENALLHARPTGGGHAHEGYAPIGCALAGTDELFPDRASHRPTHEGEVHHRELASPPLDHRSAGDHRVSEARAHLGLGEPLRVGPEIEEPERVGRAQLGVRLLERPAVG